MVVWYEMKLPSLKITVRLPRLSTMSLFDSCRSISLQYYLLYLLFNIVYCGENRLECNNVPYGVAFLFNLPR